MRALNRERTSEWAVQATGNLTLIVVVGAIIAISWSGVFDQYAEANIDNAFKNSAFIYGIARGINAVISVLQSAQASLFIGTVTVGEFLDPINDLIERFSEIMTFALVSLSMQEILLAILKDTVFSLMLTISGIFLLSQVLLNGRYAAASFKLFVTMSLLRLSLALALALNVVVDHAFINSKIEQGKTQMNVISKDVGTFQRLITQEQDTEIATDQESINKKIQSYEADQASKDKIIEELQAQISKQKEAVSTFNQGLSFMDRINVFEKSAEDRKLEELNGKLNEEQKSLETINDQIDSAIKALDCAQRKSRGESCSWLEKWKSKMSAFSAIQQVESLSNQIRAGIGNMINLLALIVLQSILLPLLFWFAVLRAIKNIWLHEWYFLSRTKKELATSTLN